jgi:predicted esterase
LTRRTRRISIEGMIEGFAQLRSLSQGALCGALHPVSTQVLPDGTHSGHGARTLRVVPGRAIVFPLHRKAGSRALSLVVLAGALLCHCTAGPAVKETAPRSGAGWNGEPIVSTRFGAVQGFADADDTWVWKAIPYARPPVGELRWRAPQDPVPWSGIRSERSFNAGCTQYSLLRKKAIRGSEDCLYLNVWRPRDGETGLPVYVFIHGGGNEMGYASQLPSYHGNRLASRSRLVFVSLNFRLGPFGWFTHPALRKGQSDLDASGNYGLLDMIKALEWIRDNIEAFGGDPRRVTLTGQSSGGMDVLALLIAPGARGLFQRAMVQSGVARTSSVAEADLSFPCIRSS